MADGLEMNLVLDVAGLGILGAKKFPSRGQVVKQRAHFYLSSRCLAGVAHNIDLAAVHDDFCSGNRARFAGR